MGIELSSINLGLPILKNPAHVASSLNVQSDSGLRDEDLINSYKNQRAAFFVFQRLLSDLNLANGLFIIPSCCSKSADTREEELVVKKAEPGKDRWYPGDAAIFKYEINTKTGFNESRYGLAQHSDTGSFFTGSGTTRDNYEYAQKPRTFGELKTKFAKFLELTFPTLATWDEEIAQREFASASNDYGDLPAWLAVRVISDLGSKGEQTIEIDGDKFSVQEALECVDARMVKAVKLGPDTFELVST